MRITLFLAILLYGLPQTALAAVIQGPAAITASTSVTPCAESVCAGLGTDINQIADGDTSNLNGFAGNTGDTGTIRLDFDRPYNLDSFTLWNDVNVSAEGVGTFQLRFFDDGGTLIDSSAVLTAPVGQVAGEVYAFSSTLLNVARVDLDVLSLLNNTRIEIREVAFTGQPVLAVPSAAGTGALILVALAYRRYSGS